VQSPPSAVATTPTFGQVRGTVQTRSAGTRIAAIRQVELLSDGLKEDGRRVWIAQPALVSDITRYRSVFKSVAAHQTCFCN